ETVNVIWDASANSGYTNDITIIGEDDNSGLDQRISKNSRPGTGSDIPWVTLATTNNFVAANSDSNRTPLGNGNFMAISSDTGTTEFETTFDAVADARMNKVWKVSETGTVGNIFIAIPKTGPTKYFGANGVNAIVVSADLNFNTLDTVVILQDNNNMYFAEINPANGNFFTFANVPLSISGISSATVSENAAYTSSTPSISPSVTVTYSLSGADASKFTVNSSTGVVQMTAKNFEAPEDADSNNVYELTLIATDDGGNTAELAYNVTVTDVDEVVDLTLSGISNTTINENTAYNSTAYNLSGSPFGTATFSLVGADKNLFTLDTNTNIVSMVAKDFEAPSDSNGDNVYEVGVFVVDTAGNSDTLTWTVTVTNVNETANFSIQTIADVSIMENTVYQSVTPTITGTPLGTVTFSMQGSDSDDFNINSSTGVLTLSNPDFENPTDTDNNNIYEIGVVATDADGNTANTSWQVTVTNVSETATLIITEIEDTTVDENQTYSSGVPAYTGVPVGAPIFSISGADASKFSVNETTGVVSMTAQNFESPTDANTDNGYEVTLIMKDADNNTDTESWKVVVRNVEEVSILNLGQMDNAYIPENTTYTSEAPVLTGTPIGDITYTIEGDDASQFMINALTGVVSMQSKDFENPTDANIDNVYEIIIRIRDGDSNTATTSLKVEVSNVKNEGGTVNGLVELQELIDKGEDIKISHLKNIIGILRLALENEKGYSIAIHQNKSKLSNPPTLEEIQTLVDRVNAEQANPKVSVVSFIGPGMEGERNAWVIPDLYKFPNNTVFVYNRWGKKIFEQKGYQNDWRGIYEGNNKPLPSGSYYYQIDLNNNGVIDQDGWIYISN
ncbi:MAG: gliding motility-associated C-terminal domain-containing protein, partial [Flavobacteriaceae bacterium]|nr:gliding motility-associated C-terminal domain-containing protein [Flavobacteriaceae bacterium]